MSFIQYQYILQVAIDFVGPISPTSTNGNRFILTVSDYFTKWVRDHLHSCLNKGTFSPFPIRRVGQKVHKITNIVKIPVYCKCQMPEIKDLKMIQCSACSEWYHIDACVQVSEEVIKKRSSIWLCDNCDKISV